MTKLNVEIRPLHESDLPYLYQICLKTGDAGKNAESLFNDPYILGQYYAAPYLFYAKDCCLVADIEGVPHGYILGTTDSTSFYKIIEKEWLPTLRHRYPKSFVGKSQAECSLVETIHNVPSVIDKSWATEYPAHLHIDLLSDLQGQGAGRALMETFLDNLRSKAVPGVHLGVDAKNTGAIAFYKKMGFSVLEEAEWGLYLGHRF